MSMNQHDRLVGEATLSLYRRVKNVARTHRLTIDEVMALLNYYELKRSCLEERQAGHDTKQVITMHHLILQEEQIVKDAVENHEADLVGMKWGMIRHLAAKYDADEILKDVRKLRWSSPV